MPFHFCPQELVAIMVALPFIAMYWNRIKTAVMCLFCKKEHVICEKEEIKDDHDCCNYDHKD